MTWTKAISVALNEIGVGACVSRSDIIRFEDYRQSIVNRPGQDAPGSKIRVNRRLMSVDEGQDAAGTPTLCASG